MRQRDSKTGPSGFTLIELMIVVAIIGILASVAIPKFANLIRKSTEGKIKGNLGAMRSALPQVKVPDFHPDTTIIRHNLSPNGFGCASGYVLDTGEWIYWSDNGAVCGGAGTFGQRARTQGEFWVACSHTDTKGSFWTTY